MASFRELLAQTKAEITEVATEDGAARRLAGATILDVREPDEVAQGVIPGSGGIVRGNLEAQIENHVPDKDTPNGARLC